MTPDGHGPGAGAAAAVGGAEGLVHVQMHDIEAHIAKAGAAKEGIQIGAVAVEKGALAVQHLGDAADVGLEQPESVGQGEHEGGHAIVQGRGQGLHVSVALIVRGHRYHLEAAHGGSGRVGAVGGIGHQDAGAALLAPVGQVGLDHQDAGKLALGAGRRRQAHGIQAGDLRQPALEVVHQGQGPLHRLQGLKRVEAGKARKAGQFLVHLRVVLHGAASQGVEAGVHAVVEAAEGQEVAHQVHLA